MFYKVFQCIEDAETFEAACTLAGLGTQPEFEEMAGEALYQKAAGVILLPVTEKEDELTEAEAEDIADESLALANIFMEDMT